MLYVAGSISRPGSPRLNVQTEIIDGFLTQKGVIVAITSFGNLSFNVDMQRNRSSFQVLLDMPVLLQGERPFSETAQREQAYDYLVSKIPYFQELSKFFRCRAAVLVLDTFG